MASCGNRSNALPPATRQRRPRRGEGSAPHVAFCKRADHAVLAARAASSTGVSGVRIGPGATEMAWMPCSAWHLREAADEVGDRRLGPARGVSGVFRFVEVRDRHVGALTGTGDRDGPADAAVGADDDRGLAGEPAMAQSLCSRGRRAGSSRLPGQADSAVGRVGSGELRWDGYRATRRHRTASPQPRCQRLGRGLRPGSPRPCRARTPARAPCREPRRGCLPCARGAACRE